MTPAHKFADAVGRKNLSSAVGKGLSAVSNAVSRGWFPSSWYLAAAELAATSGVECDPVLFGMVTSNNTQDVKEVSGAQVNATGTKRKIAVKTKASAPEVSP